MSEPPRRARPSAGSPARAARAAAIAAADALSRRVRRFRRGFGLPGARLVFDARYALPSGDVVDGKRAEKILDHLGRERILFGTRPEAPTALRIRDVMRVHDADYLATLDEPDVLERLFASRRSGGAPVASILEAQRWATAGTVSAALTALRYPWIKSPVFNLGGGFHHARRASGSGFCALNDVAIAIDRLRARGFAGKVLVIDLDLHHGDGTRSIFADDPLVYTCSVHARSLDDSPAVASLDVELGAAVGDETYLRTILDTLPEAFERAQPQLVFYVAGADVAAGDALGEWRLSAGAVARRDRAVLERARGIPTVVLLAGGYGQDAWRFPARTLVWLLTGDDVPIPSADERALDRFRAIKDSLSEVALRRPQQADDEALTFTEADLFGDLFDKTPDRRFLGFYSSFGLELAFERYGLAEHLRSKGYDAFVIADERAARAANQSLRVYADATRTETLIELALTDLHVDPGAKLLSIEWLLLQDPRGELLPGAPLLPGQKHPGLGCLRIVLGMLVMVCERLGYDGITLIPAHFHVATVARRLFTFLDPADEAYFLALARATIGLSIADASLLIGGRQVLHAAGREPAPYRPARMVLPVSDALRSRLEDAGYARTVEERARELDLVLGPATGTRTACVNVLQNEPGATNGHTSPKKLVARDAAGERGVRVADLAELAVGVVGAAAVEVVDDAVAVLVVAVAALGDVVVAGAAVVVGAVDRAVAVVVFAVGARARRRTPAPGPAPPLQLRHAAGAACSPGRRSRRRRRRRCRARRCRSRAGSRMIVDVEREGPLVRRRPAGRRCSRRGTRSTCPGRGS